MDATKTRSHPGEGGRKHAPLAPNSSETLARAHNFTLSPTSGLEERRMTLKSIGRTMTRRMVWLVMVLALVLVLALSACGGRGGLAGNRGNSNSGDQGNTGSQSASVTQVTQTDDDLNAIMSALDSANQDLNIDDSGQDSEIVP
jgi:hypothetical protein